MTIANDSTLECHNAAIWLIHGGLFSVTVVKVENTTMQIDLVTLPSGAGVSLAEHGGVYFDSTSLISLSLEQNVSSKVKENLDVGVSGMLRCRTYDRSSRSKTQPYEQSTYFQALSRLPIEKSLTLYATPLETNVTLNNLPQHRGLRLIIKNAYYEHETLDIKMAFYGTYGLKMKGDFDLGPEIAHVVSYIRSENIMIGISSVKGSYLVSNDSGESWMSVDRGYFTYLRFYHETVSEIPIPFIKVPNFATTVFITEIPMY
ncbi:hypothetical protein TSMEX_009174 [Taenia solium]|eukprot:TsM_000518400 transcript=TsM_000518400 gene=TsM_000518400